VKKLLLIFTLLPFLAVGQTFTENADSIIPDNNITICYPITISGLPTQIDTTFGIVSTCINILHPYTADLKIWLKSPDNTLIMLAGNVGGGGSNFIGTCFRMDSTIGPINQGTPPFSANYLPHTPISYFNNGQDPNGTWYLCVLDEVPLDEGHLFSFSITFGNNPPVGPPPPPGQCSWNNPLACACPDGSQICDLLPDLTASALIIQNNHTEYNGYLTLSNATPNIGWGPVEVRGTGQCYCDTTLVACSTVLCPDGTNPKELITQRIYHKNTATMTYTDVPAGTMSYHPSHGHIHVDNWAHFSLRLNSMDPDARNWPMLGTGSKVSFCLINLGDCSLNLGYCVDSLGNTITKADIPNADFGTISGCGIEQGIFTGSLDIYSEGMDGMKINFPGVCNGDYYIVSITDPDNNFIESNENNNWVAVPVTLTQQPGTPVNATFNFTNSGSSFVFTPNITGGNYTYQWDFGDGNTNTSYTASHTYTQPGTYTVTLKVTGACFGMTAQTVFVLPVDIDDAVTSGFSGLKIYPNPFSETLKISFSLNNAVTVLLEIYNAVGQLVEVLEYKKINPGQHEYAFDAKRFSAGIYHVKMTTTDKSETVKVVNLKK
jgi:hypothetical protein